MAIQNHMAEQSNGMATIRGIVTNGFWENNIGIRDLFLCLFIANDNKKIKYTMENIVQFNWYHDSKKSLNLSQLKKNIRGKKT